ncbi:glycosyltransferase family A protein [Prochlorococcus marinus]|uniref:glycosyltransferase family A protein n=1 Tax=Prochlorococcus marinus TaxID=1219 RepID=UPI0022B34561|nr:glycosyltransferase family A protein [Prochlorococcus marinus]
MDQYLNGKNTINTINSPFSISLVIGCIFDDIDMCKKILGGLGQNLDYLDEIICVISNVPQEQLDDLTTLPEKLQLSKKLFVYVFNQVLLPGEARNYCIKQSTSNYLAFLDARTIPENNWLSNACEILKSNNKLAILGRTRYIWSSTFEECFIASTYGQKALITIPGMVINKALFCKIGFFIPSLRSGEDGEWIERARYFSKKLKDQNMIPLRYENIKGKTFLELCRKWYENYSNNSVKLLIYQKQRYLYILFFAGLLVSTALSWNNNIAGWDQDYFLFIPHISKITVTSLALIYFAFRVFIIPFKKGIKIFKIGPKKIIFIFLISFTLDIIKTLAFFRASIKSDSG